MVLSRFLTLSCCLTLVALSKANDEPIQICGLEMRAEQVPSAPALVDSVSTDSIYKLSNENDLIYLLQKSQAGVMVRFSDDDEPPISYSDFTGKWSDYALSELVSQDIVECAVAATKDGSSNEEGGLLSAARQSAKQSTATCFIAIYRRESPSSICMTVYPQCGEQNSYWLDNEVSIFADGIFPDSDQGLVSFHDVADLVAQSSSYTLVRYGNDWETRTRSFNLIWEHVAQAVAWEPNKINVKLLRVDCALDNACTGMDVTFPLLWLYSPHSPTTHSSEFVLNQDALLDGGYKISLQNELLDFLKENTEWTPRDCDSLAEDSLPFWTFCEPRAETIQEPPLLGPLFHIQSRGHFIYLLQNYQRVFILFTDFKSEGSTVVFRPLYERLAVEYRHLSEKGGVAMAVTKSVTESELDSLEYDSDTCWYKVDDMSINFGAPMFVPECMFADYNGIEASVTRPCTYFDCEMLVPVKDCSTLEQGDLPQEEHELRWQLDHIAKVYDN